MPASAGCTSNPLKKGAIVRKMSPRHQCFLAPPDLVTLALIILGGLAYSYAKTGPVRAGTAAAKRVEQAALAYRQCARPSHLEECAIPAKVVVLRLANGDVRFSSGYLDTIQYVVRIDPAGYQQRACYWVPGTSPSCKRDWPMIRTSRHAR